MRRIDNMEKWVEMSFDKLLRVKGNIFMKRPTLAKRMVQDKTRQTIMRHVNAAMPSIERDSIL